MVMVRWLSWKGTLMCTWDTISLPSTYMSTSHRDLLSRWLENKRPIVNVNWAQLNQLRWINAGWGLWLSHWEMELMLMHVWIRITGFYCIYTATTQNHKNKKKHIKLGWILLGDYKNKRLVKSTFCNIPVGGTATTFIISECIWITLR